MYIHCTNITRIFISSYNIQQVLTAVNFFWIEHQKFQHVEFFGVDEGKTLISTMVIKCFKGEEASRYNSKTQKIEMALPVKSPEVKQLQGAMLISFSSNEIAENILELEQKSLLITGIIIVLASTFIEVRGVFSS